MFAPVPDQRIVAGAAATLRWQHVDQDGEPTDPGTVTVEVVRNSDGSQVLPAGTATTSDGTARTVSIPASDTASLDLLTATWTRTATSTSHVTRAEVVGGVYFTVAQARSSDASINDLIKYPTDTLQRARSEIEDEFERICELAFVPRFRREALNGSGEHRLMLPTPLPRNVRSVTELDAAGNVVAWSSDDVDNLRLNESGQISGPRGFPHGRANILVIWEHGHDRPPDDVRQAALLRLRTRAIRPHTAIPDRASRFQVEGGSVYTLDTAGRHRTGIPDVDAVLDRWSMAIPGVA